MTDFLLPFYPWIKSLHIISVIAWMAAMLYLPRLFVYHVDAEPGSDKSETFKLMEERLYKVIMTPAMGATWIFGLLLVATPGIVVWAAGYFHLKLLLVLGLSGFHGFLGTTVRKFAADANQRPAKFYRMVNEIPTVAMIIIVIMIVVRPF